MARVHGCLRGHDPPHGHEGRAVVRRPRRSQVVHAPRRGRRNRGRAERPGSRTAAADGGSKAGAERSAHRSFEEGKLIVRTVLCVFLLAAALPAQDYPHAFPREGVRKLFDNERITIWEVNWKINVPQPIHRHRYDMAGVYLRFGKIAVTTPDGRSTIG